MTQDTNVRAARRQHDSWGEMGGAVSAAACLKQAERERLSHGELLAGINRILQTVVTSESCGETLAATCVQVATELTRSDFACVSELGADGAPRRIAGATSGSSCAWAPSAGLPPDARCPVAALREQVLKSGCALLQNGPLPTQPGAAATGPTPAACLCVPLKHRDGIVLGALTVGKRSGVYSDTELAVLETLAPSIAEVLARCNAESALAELNHTLEQRVAARTAEAQEQAGHLRALASQLSRVEQSERQRLATILQEQILQLIVAAQMQLGTIVRDASSERMSRAAGAARDALDDALRKARSLTVELSPPVLMEVGLIAALEWLADRLEDEHDFAVELKLDPAAEPGDDEVRALLFECAQELLGNVVSHAGAGHARLSLQHTGANTLALVVADPGRGFDPELLARRRTDDTSFGLFSIRERLAHLGGQMAVRTAPGHGTEVRLLAPLRIVPVSVAPLGAAASQTPTPARRARPDIWRVLIVDDHQIMRQGLAGLFQAERDIEVVGEAADGEEAVALTAALRPHVVIMDVDLGGAIDGIQATRRVVAHLPETRVIGLSMHMDEVVSKAMLEAGAVAFLTKGGPCEDLLAIIRSAG
jgi:signal transduction histidine kinase/CheY-like chemotaxis protein